METNSSMFGDGVLFGNYSVIYQYIHSTRKHLLDNYKEKTLSLAQASVVTRLSFGYWGLCLYGEENRETTVIKSNDYPDTENLYAMK